MFNKGDKVSHPMHGAGIIEDIEKKEVLGKKLDYYIIKMPINNLKLMVSTQKAQEIGIRRIIGKDDLNDVIKILKSTKTKMPDNWNDRYQVNIQKIKTGDIMEVAEVVKNLYIRELDKGLSNIEKKLYKNAKQILLSEIIVLEDIEKDLAEEKLYSYLNREVG